MMKNQRDHSRFAWVLDDTVARGDAVWDEIVASNDHFVVVPSKGSIVPGWLLAIPRRPMLNLSALRPDEREALRLLIHQLEGKMSAFDGDVFCFEHGSSTIGSLTGCGVDQAHLHLVPLPFDLIQASLNCDDDRVRWDQDSQTEILTRLPTIGEYIAVWRTSTETGHIGSIKQPVSQWTRRVIAQKLGVETEWDYRTHPQEASIRATLKELINAPIAAGVQ